MPPLSQNVDINDYADKLSKNAIVLFLVDHQNNCDAGFAAVYLNNEIDKVAFLSTIGVKSEYRRTGIADNLLKAVIDLCQKKQFSRIDLEVHPENHAAVNLYLKNGFVVNKDNDRSSAPGSISMSRKIQQRVYNK
jgi:ribosomal protein S18 acetylase RimI-like enzyme